MLAFNSDEDPMLPMFDNTFSFRSLFWITPLLCSLVLGVPAGIAQAQTFAQAEARHAPDSEAELTSLLHENASLPALHRSIALNLKQVAFEEALQIIAARGDFGVSYNPDLLPQRSISLPQQTGTVENALRNLLVDTALDALISPQREIIIVQRAATQAPSAAPQPAALPAMAELNLRKLQARGTLALERPQPIISGQVTDAQDGTPIPGVNVVVQGTTIGTATDANGRYEIDAPDDAEALVFSAVGYVTQEVPINGRTTIDVQLQSDVEALEEVVVVGYGTQQRAEVTGSVASVSSQDVQDLAVESFETAIQGKLAGVEVRQSTGEPGASPSVRVRGTGSISAGNDPLFVIDGLPITRDEGAQGTLFRRRGTFTPPSLNPLSTLNTNDIESIEVLKDASAAAIYGSRGSNGVVLITTKKGARDGSPVVRYNGYYGVQNVTNTPDMMNSEEVVDYTIDARNNNYTQKYGAPPPNPRTNEGRPEDDAFVLIPDKYIEYDQGERTTDTDWLDLILEPAPMFSSNLSVSGGSDNVGYFISGGILQQDGTIDRSDFERYSLRVNVEADPAERVRVGANVSTSLTLQDRLPASAPYFARPPGIVYSAMVHSPVIEPFNDDGSPNQRNGQSFLGGGTTSASHPIAIRDAVTEDLDHHRTFGTAYSEVDLLEYLTFKTQFGADLSDYTRNFYRANSLLYRTASEGEPYAQSASSRSFNWLSENTLSYDRDYGTHRVNALLGFTAQQERTDLNSVIAQNFPDDEVPTINGGQVTDGTSRAEEWSLLSYLARVNYSYQQTYLLTATLRADQSSRFGPNNRTGVFPSASAGWRLSEEDFMANLSTISDLKLRVSYGVTGNFLIPNYGSFGLLDTDDYVDAGQNVISGVSPSSIGNADLTWETTRALNIGLDAGLFDDRITLVADYYRSTTSDLLLNVSLPAATGFETVLTNIGEVQNEGLELVLSTDNLVGDFSWSTDFNFSTNRNEVTALGPEGAPILSSGAAGLRHITRIGNEVGSYYGYVVDGVYRDQSAVDNALPDTEAPDPAPGDFQFRDVDGDGEITPDDRTVTGSYFPDFTYGITNRFAYRGFDLNIFLQGVEGREILNLTSRHMKNGEANFNSYAIFNERWRSPENPGNGEVPRADRQTGLHGNNNRPSSFQVEDGSYLRLRNVTLGYSFPITFLGQATRRARIYLSGQNLFTITDYLGFNPEVNLQSTPLTPGEDYGAYPLSRVYTLGVDFTF